MKILVMDQEALGIGLNFCLRCQDYGHTVKYWQPCHPGKEPRAGEGMVHMIPDYKPWMKWADMIVFTDNCRYIDDLETYFKRGYPIIGANKAAGAIELDRNLGQKVLDDCDIETIPYEMFTSFDKAIAYVLKTNKTYVSKPLGDQDKGFSYVPDSPADLIYMLQTWKEMKALKDGFILQEMCEGTEMAVGGWFGKHGWNKQLCENWEEKRFMNDGLGINTGEQGTTLRYVEKSQLFLDTLEPCTDYLHSISYRGYVDMNCIVDKKGNPRPLEFTMRFGWPLFNIQMALHEGDPAGFLCGLLEGKDTLKVSKDVAVGVVISHGDYPGMKQMPREWDGRPLYGVTAGNRNAIHPVGVRNGVAPTMVGGKVSDVDMMVTANQYVAVVTGTGESVSQAAKACYEVAWDLKLPSNRMFRTDISKRLENELPILQANGYALGMEY
jgi:phosphoribosylamine--glycine ligase